MYVLELAGEDDAFARAEARSACTGVTGLAPGLATARGLTDRVRGLAFTRIASELVGTCAPAIADAVTLLEAATADRDGTVAVRARDVRATAGVDTAVAESALGQVLVDRGFAVDLETPAHELRALFAEGVCAIGWRDLDTVRDFGDRQPTDRPFFQPGGMEPLLARAVVNMAGARPGRRFLDPTCGTGGLLAEAGLVGADVVGVDVQARMVRGARENLTHELASGTTLGEPGAFEVLQGDATQLALRDNAVDAVAFDVPYGRQSRVVDESVESLVPAALAEARRVAPRGVVVADRPWTAAATAAGWSVTDRFEHRVHRSLTRHLHVLAAD